MMDTKEIAALRKQYPHFTALMRALTVLEAQSKEIERKDRAIKEALEYRMGSVANAILRDALAPAADPEKCSFCEGPATDADGCCEALCPYAASAAGPVTTERSTG